MSTSKTFTCHKCGRTMPYDFPHGNPSCGENLGFGVFEFCKDCVPPKTVEEVIEDFDLFINPIKECPAKWGE